MASRHKSGQMKVAVNSVTGEQASKEQDFGAQEHPHSDGAGVPLLFHVVELMRDCGCIRGSMSVRHLSTSSEATNRSLLYPVRNASSPSRDARLSRVRVSLLLDHGRFLEIFRRWRRGRLPLQSLGSPRIGTGWRPVAHGPDQVHERDQVAYGENRGTRRGHYVQDLELGRIHRIAARHTQVPQHVLWKERKIEPEENYQRREPRPSIRIEAPAYFGPPEMNTSQIAHHRAAHHNVMEMGNDEVGAAQVDVRRKRRQEQSRQPSHGKKSDESYRIKHRGIVGDGTFVHRCRPVEYLDGGGNSDHKTQHREDQAGVNGLAAHEHVMAPDQEAENSDGQAGKSDHLIAKNSLLGKTGHEFADHAHGGQDHYVDRRM